MLLLQVVGCGSITRCVVEGGRSVMVAGRNSFLRTSSKQFPVAGRNCFEEVRCGEYNRGMACLWERHSLMSLSLPTINSPWLRQHRLYTICFWEPRYSFVDSRSHTPNSPQLPPLSRHRHPVHRTIPGHRHSPPWTQTHPGHRHRHPVHTPLQTQTQPPPPPHDEFRSHTVHASVINMFIRTT